MQPFFNPFSFERFFHYFFKEEEAFDRLQKRVDQFNRKIPFNTRNNSPEAVGKTDLLKKEIVEHAAGVRPVLNGKVFSLMEQFIGDKRQNGSEVEKRLYQNMDVQELIDRLLKKRPVVFIDSRDLYMLRDGSEGQGGFDKIGTEEERSPLVLNEYISYDEMLLSALLAVSVPTHFINSGIQTNRGARGAEGSYEEKGILVGMVGARFEKPGYMEWQQMIVTREQNRPENGYGREGLTAAPEKFHRLSLWARFYGQGHGGFFYFPSFDEVEKSGDENFIKIREGYYLNRKVYKERIRLSAESFLAEANERAKQAGKKAYVDVEGIGLGFWRASDAQFGLTLEVYLELLKENEYPHIATLNLNRITKEKALFEEAKKRVGYEKSKVGFDFTERGPSQKLTGENSGKLLIASYAWDGNSYPGNEYWWGSLCASADPAAASSSMIAVLQNPEINESLSGKQAVIMPPQPKKC